MIVSKAEKASLAAGFYDKDWQRKDRSRQRPARERTEARGKLQHGESYS